MVADTFSMWFGILSTCTRVFRSLKLEHSLQTEDFLKTRLHRVCVYRKLEFFLSPFVCNICFCDFISLVTPT